MAQKKLFRFRPFPFSIVLARHFVLSFLRTHRFSLFTKRQSNATPRVSCRSFSQRGVSSRKTTPIRCANKIAYVQTRCPYDTTIRDLYPLPCSVKRTIEQQEANAIERERIRAAVQTIINKTTVQTISPDFSTRNRWSGCVFFRFRSSSRRAASYRNRGLAMIAEAGLG